MMTDAHNRRKNDDRTVRQVTITHELGYSPMSENPILFLQYLASVLDDIAVREQSLSLRAERSNLVPQEGFLTTRLPRRATRSS